MCFSNARARSSGTNASARVETVFIFRALANFAQGGNNRNWAATAAGVASVGCGSDNRGRRNDRQSPRNETGEPGTTRDDGYPRRTTAINIPCARRGAARPAPSTCTRLFSVSYSASGVRRLGYSHTSHVRGVSLHSECLLRSL